MNRLQNATLVLVSLVLLAGCSSAITPDKMSLIKPAMKADQVVALLGQPAHIDQSETSDQLIQGEVYHYPSTDGEGRVVFLNGAVFQAQFVPGGKQP